MECSECHQQVTTWNEVREEEVEKQTVASLLLGLAAVGGPNHGWKRAADNAIQKDLSDGYVVVLVRPYIKEN